MGVVGNDEGGAVQKVGVFQGGGRVGEGGQHGTPKFIIFFL